MSLGEFQRAVEGLGRQVSNVDATTRETLKEAQKASHGVILVEARVRDITRRLDDYEQRLEALEDSEADRRRAQQPATNLAAPLDKSDSARPLTRWDLALFSGALGGLLWFLRLLGKI